MFDVLKIKDIEETELDVAITSDSANGLVKTRAPYTKVRKSFIISPNTYSTDDEFNEVKLLWDTVRTVLSFTFSHPTEKDSFGNPKQYTVRFKEALKWKQSASSGDFYQISPFTLVEV